MKRRRTSSRVSLGNGDHGVGLLDGGALHPCAEMVGVAQLLDLPGAQRFERVDGQHVGHAPELAGKQAAHIGVPGVAVDHIGIQVVLRHRQAAGEGIDSAHKARVGILSNFVPGP